MTTKRDAVKDAALASATPAAFARAIGKDGRGVRNVLRSRFGVYVSKDGAGAFDDALKSALYAHIVDHDADALGAWREAHAK